MQWKRRFSMLALLTILGIVLAACGTPQATQTGTATSAADASETPASAAPSAVATQSTAAESATADTSATAGAETATAEASATAGAETSAPAAGADLLPGGDPNVPDAYLKAPAPFKSVQRAPGNGDAVSVLQFTFQPPIPGREQNQFWQELEKRLNVTWNATLVPADGYQERLSAVVAGGSLPDLILARDVDSTQIKLIRQGAYCDLTPYLSGDAIKEFPNLARFSPRVWQVSTIDGKIYSVPRPRPLVPTTLLWRQDWADKLGMSQPKNADEFFQLMNDFTKKDPDGNGQNDTFGLGAEPADPFSFVFARYMFRVPNVWKLNADGTFTKDVETPEFKQALEYTRKLYEAGVYHPDTATMNLQQAKDFVVGGKIGGFESGLPALPGPSGMRALGTQVNPDTTITGLIPPGHDGGNGVAYQGFGYFGNVLLGAQNCNDPERVKELLRILDYFAAPFGSEESIFLTNGIDGVHNTVNPGGTRTRSDLGKQEIGDLAGIASAPPVYFYPDQPDDAKLMQEIQRQLVEISIDNPTFGLFSETDAARNQELGRFISDQVNAMITGRAPLSDLDTMIEQWRQRGGDQIRKEYEAANKQRQQATP